MDNPGLATEFVVQLSGGPPGITCEDAEPPTGDPCTPELDQLFEVMAELKLIHDIGGKHGGVGSKKTHGGLLNGPAVGEEHGAEVVRQLDIQNLLQGPIIGTVEHKPERTGGIVLAHEYDGTVEVGPGE